MSTQVIEITGMSCGHCEGKVTKELAKITGLTLLSISASEGRATVESETALDNDLLERAVSAAGFSAVSVNSL